jgi:hypothetical protein
VEQDTTLAGSRARGPMVCRACRFELTAIGRFRSVQTADRESSIPSCGGRILVTSDLTDGDSWAARCVPAFL